MHNKDYSANTDQELLRTLRLKFLKRAGWLRTSVGEIESVASHSWGTAWLALLTCPEGLCAERVLKLALIHDLAEVVTGDITPYDGIDAQEKAEMELSAFKDLTSALPKAAHLLDLFNEYQECRTPEAVFVHRCDKIDMKLQAEYYMREQPGLDLSEFIESARTYLQRNTLNKEL